MLQCDLLDMPAIGQLEMDAKYALVYQLLKIFLTQRLDAYMEFQAANSNLLKSYGTVLDFLSFTNNQPSIELKCPHILMILTSLQCILQWCRSCS